MVISPIAAAPSRDSRPHPAKKAVKSNSIFEDDDDGELDHGASKFSDEEDDDSFEGDDGSSGIGSEDSLPELEELDEDLQRHVRTAAPRESGWVQTGAKPKPKQSYVRGGYDYGLHMKESGKRGSVFVSKEGRVSTVGEDDEEESSKKVAGPQLLPAELFASKPSKDAVRADQHDKMFGASEDIDPEVQAMLDSSDDEDEEKDEEDLLADDFVMQALKPAEGEEDDLDVRAYLDNIIRTGKLPHELADPFGDDALEDIDEFLDAAPHRHGQKGAKKHGHSKPQSSPAAAPKSSLDDIDDDVDSLMSKVKISRKQAGGRKVRFDSGEESDEEDEEYDSDMFEDDDDEELDEIEKRARKMGAAPDGTYLTAFEAARALYRFETALADYDETMEIEEDNPLAQGSRDVNDFEDILDQFIGEAVELGLRPATDKSELARQKTITEDSEQDAAAEVSEAGHVRKKKKKVEGTYDPVAFARRYASVAEGEGESGDEYEEVEGREEPQWDVESYVSTYTNTENHPRILEQTALNRRIQVGKGGMPTGVLQHERKLSAKAEKARQKEEDAAFLASREASRTRVNTGVARPKDETPEERKARKEAQKLEKKVNREVKKQLKDSFRSETVRQQRAEAKNSRATIVHL